MKTPKILNLLMQNVIKIWFSKIMYLKFEEKRKSGGAFSGKGPGDETVPTPYENPVCATDYDLSDIFHLFGLKWFQFAFYRSLRSRFECKSVGIFLLLPIQLFHDFYTFFLLHQIFFSSFSLQDKPKLNMITRIDPEIHAF